MANSEPVAPFFLLYSSRSGSTFLARLLTERLGAVIPPESRFLGRLLAAPVPPTRVVAITWLDFILRWDRKFADWNVDRHSLVKHLRSLNVDHPRDLVSGLIRYYLVQRDANEGAIQRFGFKKGDYGRFASRILEWYPAAKFICLLRDGRAVYSSQRRAVHSETKRPMQSDARSAARLWTTRIETFERIRRLVPRGAILIRYEDLIADQRRTVDNIGTLLGLRPDSSYLQEGSAQSTADLVPVRFAEIHRHVFKDPLTERIDAWRTELPPAEVAMFESVARPKLAQYGYTCVT